MSAMIPHHSIAILTSERSGIEDVRACELAVAITEAQRREISEMNWLIQDIDANALPRPVPRQSSDPSRPSREPAVAPVGRSVEERSDQ